MQYHQGQPNQQPPHPMHGPYMQYGPPHPQGQPPPPPHPSMQQPPIQQPMQPSHPPMPQPSHPPMQQPSHPPMQQPMYSSHPTHHHWGQPPPPPMQQPMYGSQPHWGQPPPPSQYHMHGQQHPHSMAPYMSYPYHYYNQPVHHPQQQPYVHHQSSHQPQWSHPPMNPPPQHMQQYPSTQPHYPQPIPNQNYQAPSLPPVASPHRPTSQPQTPQHVPPAPRPVAPTPAPASPKIEKKEATFPPNTVEATKLVSTKRKKLTSKDISDIEMWRLIMCLKSGLLAESSWAIDVLVILLSDDATSSYFALQNCPGLLEMVIEHYKRCLNEIFDDMVQDTILKTETVYEDLELAEDKSKSGPPLLLFRTAKNYTYKTRDGKIVKIKDDKERPVVDINFSPIQSGYSHWREGNGEDISHIQVYLEPGCNSQISLARRCASLSSIIRNLSFISGNDTEMSKHAGLLLILGRLLLHKPNPKFDSFISESGCNDDGQWHCNLLNSIREDALVTLSNFSYSLDLAPFNEKINLSILEGLIHWFLEPYPVQNYSVSPQKLALESLAKLSINDGNVDLLLATPPWSRIQEFLIVLSRFIGSHEDQTTREFSLVLISNLVYQTDSSIARTIATKGLVIPQLIAFLEAAEAVALEVAASHGHKALKEPEASGTTNDMLRRAAQTLKFISEVKDNHKLFAQHQQRLLDLVMSTVLDQGVVSIIADVIFDVSSSSC